MPSVHMAQLVQGVYNKHLTIPLRASGCFLQAYDVAHGRQLQPGGQQWLRCLLPYHLSVN